MSPEDERHGTYAGFQQHAKDGDDACDLCREARYLYVKRMKLRLSIGVRVRVPIGEEAWAKVSTASVQQMSRATGMRDSTIHHILSRGPEGQVYVSTRDKILAARPIFTPLGIQRRIRALSRIGYASAAVAREVPCSVDAIRRIRRATTPPTFVRYEFGVAICDAYERMSKRPSPSGSSATRARAEADGQQWPAPLAWDNIDDPDEQPRRGPVRPLKTDIDPVVVQRVLGGDRLPTTHAEKVEITRRWEEQGRSLNDLERLTGWRSDRYTQREAS